MTRGLHLELAQRRNQEALHRFRQALESEMVPFRPGRVDIYKTYDMIDAWYVSIETLPDDTARLMLDWPSVNYLEDDLDLAVQLGRRAGAYFRDLPAAPLTDNIELGEN